MQLVAATTKQFWLSGFSSVFPSAVVNMGGRSTLREGFCRGMLTSHNEEQTPAVSEVIV